MNPTTIDPTRIAAAVQFAAEKHASQTRKGTDIPYLSHLLQVAGLVIEHGGDTDAAIAGLLHDSLEDCEGVDEDVLREHFGDRVATIVRECTDTLPGDTPDKKSPWRIRKERHIQHMANVSPDGRLVYACDKRHNLGAIVRDCQVHGVEYLERFNAGPGDILWYYEAVLAAIGDQIPAGLRTELANLVREFRAVIGADR